MPDLRFHFTCFALCQMTPHDPEFPADRDNQPIAELIGGFFRARDEAENFVRLNERRLLLEHEAWQRQFPWMRGLNQWEYRASHYEIVPLTNVHFSDLQTLEDNIREAAVLQFNGVGTEAVA